MTFETVASIDFQALNKRDLKRLCTLARDEWGKPIDLRSSAILMAEYLELYRQWKINQKAAEISEVEQIEEVTTAEIEKIEVVNEVVAPQEETTAPTLSCDVCNYQSCEIPKRLPIELFDGIDIDGMISLEGDRYLATPLSCDIGEWLDALRVEQQEAQQRATYWNAYARLYNKAISTMKATRLGQLLKQEHDQECREWWQNWEQKYNKAIAKCAGGNLAQLQTPKPQTIQPEADVNAKVVGLVAIAFLALMVDGILWIVKEVQQRRLVQRSFSAAILVVQRHRPRAKGFRPALLVNS